MNPLTNVRNLNKINQQELELGLSGTATSWHSQYKDSAWVFVGGLPFDLTEGDVICVFSQYGEVVQVNLVRDHKTGKSKGFGFLCYEDQRSTVLAVDNLNGAKLLSRTIRVDHAGDYKPPKEHGDEDEAMLKLREEGCAPQAPSPTHPSSDDEPVHRIPHKKPKKEKKKKKQKEKKAKKKKYSDSECDSSTSDGEDSRGTGRHDTKPIRIRSGKNGRPHVDIKTEKPDQGYDKYAHSGGDLKRNHRESDRLYEDAQKHRRDWHKTSERRARESDSSPDESRHRDSNKDASRPREEKNNRSQDCYDRDRMHQRRDDRNHDWDRRDQRRERGDDSRKERDRSYHSHRDRDRSDRDRR